ncbi:MAG TPA: hypothetical protein VFP33_12900 [Gallionella sp.]|nr:hypothetical protein [Gallionella sp.]
MRSVVSAISAYTGQGGREANGPGETYAVKPVQSRGLAPGAAWHRRDVASRERHDMTMEERRKAARRVRQQPVLVELRSPIDRRRRNRREGDIVEHIDEKV